MRNEPRSGDSIGFKGVLTIRKFRDGELVWQSEPMRNKVVTGSGGYGRNLVMRHLAGDQTYPLTIDSVSLGDDDTVAADGDTDLGNPLVTDVPLTNLTVSDNVLSIDAFIADANLPDDTYEELGFFCDGRLFSRVLITPAFTKADGEDTLFTYSLTATG